ncbi:hypothetical protein Clacol_009516 [Clathrus columnatus]|uniref:Transmembrane protein n=1 Tax=Clathrus columnatus TaxID=1419009 RepID=A0AAV5ALC6_9AGAM|nr:hypothetical protein Clacol_009516 [Clathrus columnatus]
MTTDNPEQPQRRKPPAIVSYGLLTLGGLAVIAPVLLLYRANPNRIGIRKLRKTSPPPIRQTVASVENVDTVKLGDISFRPQLIPRVHDEDEIISNPGQGPGPLHALKAFGIATCIVGATALASIAGIRTYLGIQTTDQFAQLMRQQLATIAPSLLSKIHRNISDDDSRPIAPLQTTSSRTAVSNNQELDDVVDMHSSDWLQDIEDQLEHEAALERAARLARKHNE